MMDLHRPEVAQQVQRLAMALAWLATEVLGEGKRIPATGGVVVPFRRH